MKRLFVNVFCPREQKAVSVPAARVGALLRADRLLTPPLADPRAPSIVSKRNDLTLGDQRVNLRAKRRCFCGPKVIVDGELGAIIQQIDVAIQISADVIVRVKHEQAYIATA